MLVNTQADMEVVSEAADGGDGCPGGNGHETGRCVLDLTCLGSGAWRRCRSWHDAVTAPG